MYDERPASIDLPPPATLLAWIMIVGGMIFVYERVCGPWSGDWLGYARMYDDEGGWLLDQHRDPAFLAFLGQARHLFGANGYDGFRLALAGAFGLFGLWLASEIPIQSRVWETSSILTAVIVLVALSLKGFVQIREGMAFLCVVVPVVGIVRRSRPGMARVGVGVILAATFHAGTLFLAAGWVAAVCLAALPDDILADRATQRALLAAAIVVGGVVSWAVVRNADALRSLLQDSGVDTSVRVQEGVWKLAYWLLNGAIVLALRHEVIEATRRATRFGYAYASALSSMILPLLYTVCVVMVCANFPTPAGTALMIRAFFTTSELCLIIIALRGRGTLVTLVIAVFMLADRLRLVLNHA